MLLTAACKAPCDLLFSVLISYPLGFSHNVWLDTPGQAQEHFPYCSWRALSADRHGSLPHFTHRAFLTKACSRGPLPSSYLLPLLHCSSSTCHHYLSYINRDEGSRSRQNKSQKKCSADSTHSLFYTWTLEHTCRKYVEGPNYFLWFSRKQQTHFLILRS